MIAIVGAGPSGSHLAYLLAKNGFKVQVFEEHSEVGRPVSCTGLVSEDIKEIVSVPSRLILNRIRNARIFSPSGKELKIQLAENLVLDRARFDLWLSEKAALAGAEYYLGTKFEGWTRAGRSFLLRMRDPKGRNSVFRADYVVGADGPLSAVAKEAGIYGRRSFYTAIQAEVPWNEKREIMFWLEQGGVSWIVPLGNGRALAGVAFEEGAARRFKTFCRNFGRKNLRRSSAALIPKFNPLQRLEKDRVFLVGDAAGQVKATTLGGIVPGMRSAVELSKSFNSIFGYTPRYMARVFPDLYSCLLVRRILDNCSNSELDSLVETLGRADLVKVLNGVSRDRMLSLGLKAISREPKLVGFCKRLFVKSSQKK